MTESQDVMLIKKPEPVKSSEITDQNLYLNHRLLMCGAALAASAVATDALYKQFLAPAPQRTRSAGG